MHRNATDELLRSFEKNQFLLYCQSILPLAAQENEPSYREILVRYAVEEQRFLPPGTFLPFLEEHKLMLLLDQWVVTQVLKWHRINQTTNSLVPVSRSSINLSSDAICDSAFGKYVLRCLRASEVPGRALSFEIPVPVGRANSKSLASLIAPLRTAGCSFALSGFLGDDAAFELASTLGIEFVKIEGSIIARIRHNPRIQASLDEINRRCHEMSISTVCERVEDAVTLEFLRSIRVDYAQGFGIDQPRPLM